MKKVKIHFCILKSASLFSKYTCIMKIHGCIFKIHPCIVKYRGVFYTKYIPLYFPEITPICQNTPLYFAHFSKIQGCILKYTPVFLKIHPCIFKIHPCILRNVHFLPQRSVFDGIQTLPKKDFFVGGVYGLEGKGFGVNLNLCLGPYINIVILFE